MKHLSGDATGDINVGHSNGTTKIPSNTTYDFPFGMDTLRRWSWAQYIPICPTFTGLQKCGKRQTKDHRADTGNDQNMSNKETADTNL